MTINCESVRLLTQGFSLIHACDVIRDGTLRLATPFQYPDGSHIDLFLAQETNLLRSWVLSDLGQTTAYLLDVHVRPWSTKQRKQIVADICDGLAVQQNGGQFQLLLSEDELHNLPQAIVRLAQACIRVSDLAWRQRLRVASVFREELEEFLGDIELHYETAFKLTGQFESEVEVEFLVVGQHMNSLIQTLSTANVTAAHGLSNEVFSRWYDLSPHRTKYQFLTVYDTTTNVIRNDDLSRLGNISSVLGFPAESDQLRMTLVA